ncbi:MAG: hypothetical protein RL624_395 [Bacteroidota bacterium]|jgi:uncharacterized protein (TIGR01777 family)
MKIGITGGTGLVGKRLVTLFLQKGYEVFVFTRNPKIQSKEHKLHYSYWDPIEKIIDTDVLGSLNTVIHIAGANVAEKRWTKKRKQEIEESRTISTAFLVDQINQYASNCNCFVSASAIGIYGPDISSGLPFTENAKAHTDFLGTTCVRWEDSSAHLKPSIRRVVLRMGIVLAKEGGALAQFIQPIQFFVKPYLGGGKQVISWITLEDIAQLFLYSVEQKQVQGVYNAVAPNPVSQRALMNAIAHHKNKWAVPIYVPSFFLKIILGEMSIEVLKSSTVSCEKIQQAGFQFQSSDIDQALKHLKV